MNKLLSNPKWAAQCITLGILACLAGAYYFGYVPSQRKYFTKRNFRVLALTSEQIKRTIEGLPKALTIAAKNLNELPTNSSSATIRQTLETAVGLIPALTLVGESSVAMASLTNARPSNPTNPVSITVVAGSPSVRFTYYAYHTNKEEVVMIEAKADLERMTGSPPEFDTLLLANEAGDILFQRGPTAINIQKLQNPFEAPTRESATNLIQRANTLTSLTIVGETYKVFIQPFQVAPEDVAVVNNWFVCGLVRSSRFERDNLTIPYMFLIVFIFLVLLSSLSVAFPKVAFAGAREALRKRDVMFLMISTLGGSALLSILLLDGSFYRFMEDHLDEKLVPLAKQIQTNLTEEVSHLHQLLHGLDELHATNQCEKMTNILADSNSAMARLANEFPVRFEVVFWMDTNGLQTSKWSTKETLTPLISLKDRAYFQDALKDRNSVHARRENGRNLFWVESIYSFTTGENSAVLSIPSKLRGVAAVESQLQSVIHPVLPPMYGFAIISDDGRVLFHSDSRRNLRENLFEECDNEPILRSTVISRTSREFDLRYGGRMHHLLITPIPDFHWTLIVFREEHLLSAANFETVLGTLSLLAIYFVGIPGMICLACAPFWLVARTLGRAKPLPLIPDWLWPRGEPRPYFRVAFCNFAVSAGLMLFLYSYFWSPLVAIIAGTVTVALGLMLTFLCLRPASTKVVEVEKQLFKWSYVVALTSVVFLLAGVPAFVCFNLASVQRVKLFTKQCQFSFARALSSRAEHFAGIPGSSYWPPAAEGFRGSSQMAPDNIPWGVYTNSELTVTNRAPGDNYAESHANSRNRSIGQKLASCFDRLTPIHDPSSMEGRGLLAKGAEDQSWSWTTTNGPDALDFTLRNYGPGTSLQVRAERPKWPFWQPMLVLFVLILLLLIPSAFIASQVFLINLPRTPDPQVCNQQNLEEEEKYALLHVARDGFLHMGNPVLRTLLAKGCLLWTPALKVNSVVGSEALDHIDPAKLGSHGSEGASRRWQIVKGPLYIALVALALLMFITQPEIYKTVFAVIAGFAAGPPAILQLIRSFETKDDKEKVS